MEALATLSEQFVAPFKGQLELEAKVKDLHRRIGRALEAQHDAGKQDRILIAHKGEVYDLERPAGGPF